MRGWPMRSTPTTCDASSRRPTTTLPTTRRSTGGCSGGELLDGRRQALRVIESTVERDLLTAEELESWLTALNDLRLVLGTRLDVTEETYGRWPQRRDPDARERAVYLYLSVLQEEAVQAAYSGRFAERDG